MNNKYDGVNNMTDDEYYSWLAKILSIRPKNNTYLESERGIEVAKICMNVQRKQFSWRRSDDDTFWIDVQLFTKYKLTDEEIMFALNLQPGIGAYFENSEERRAYGELVRGMEKLKKYM